MPPFPSLFSYSLDFLPSNTGIWSFRVLPRVRGPEQLTVAVSERNTYTLAQSFFSFTLPLRCFNFPCTHTHEQGAGHVLPFLAQGPVRPAVAPSGAEGGPGPVDEALLPTAPPTRPRPARSSSSLASASGRGSQSFLSHGNTRGFEEREKRKVEKRQPRR